MGSILSKNYRTGTGNLFSTAVMHYTVSVDLLSLSSRVHQKYDTVYAKYLLMGTNKCNFFWSVWQGYLSHSGPWLVCMCFQSWKYLVSRRPSYHEPPSQLKNMVQITMYLEGICILTTQLQPIPLMWDWVLTFRPSESNKSSIQVSQNLVPILSQFTIRLQFANFVLKTSIC